MSTLGFDNYVEPLKLYLQKYRESMKGEKQPGEGFEEIDDVICKFLKIRAYVQKWQNSKMRHFWTLKWPDEGGLAIYIFSDCCNDDSVIFVQQVGRSVSCNYRKRIYENAFMVIWCYCCKFQVSNFLMDFPLCLAATALQNISATDGSGNQVLLTYSGSQNNMQSFQLS